MKNLIDDYFTEFRMYYASLRHGDNYEINLKKLKQTWAKIKIELDTLDSFEELGSEYLEKLLRISGIEEGITLEDIANGTDKKGTVLTVINRIRRQNEIQFKI